MQKCPYKCYTALDALKVADNATGLANISPNMCKYLHIPGRAGTLTQASLLPQSTALRVGEDQQSSPKTNNHCTGLPLFAAPLMRQVTTLRSKASLGTHAQGQGKARYDISRHARFDPTTRKHHNFIHSTQRQSVHERVRNGTAVRRSLFHLRHLLCRSWRLFLLLRPSTPYTEPSSRVTRRQCARCVCTPITCYGGRTMPLQDG